MDSKKAFFFKDDSNQNVKTNPKEEINELKMCKQIYINNKLLKLFLL